MMSLCAQKWELILLKKGRLKINVRPKGRKKNIWAALLGHPNVWPLTINFFLVRCNLASDPRSDHVSNHRFFMKTSNMNTDITIYSIAE